MKPLILDQQPEKNLKLQVMLVLLLCLLFIVGLGTYAVNQVSKYHLNERIEDSYHGVQFLISSRIEQEAGYLQDMMRLVTDDVDLIELIKRQDRESLLERFSAIYQGLNRDSRLTHFYFTNARRINILRVHNPARFGDVINRHTTLQAQKTGKVFYGVELGMFGQLTLRLVKPLFENGVLIGFVELGKEVEHFIRNIPAAIPTEILVIINKQFLQRENWEEGMRVMNRSSSWDQFEDFVLVDSTFQTAELAYQRIRDIEQIYSIQYSHNASHDHDHDHDHDFADVRGSGRDGAEYVEFMPIEESSGRVVGDMILLLDYRELSAVIRNTTYLVLMFGMVVIAITAIMIFILLNRGQKAIRLYRDQYVKIESSLQEAQKLAYLGNWELDLVNNSLWWSDEVYRIFEIDPDKFTATYEGFVNTIHPDDRDLVNQAYQQSLVDQASYSIEHRLLMTDGRIKYVQEQGRSSFDEKGNPIRSIGTVQDISRRKRIEAELQQHRDHLEELVASRNRQLHESEYKHRILAENLADVIWTIDLKSGTIEYVSPSDETMRGFTPQEMLGQKLESIIVPDQVPEVKRTLQQRINSFLDGDKKAVNDTNEYELIRKDGSTVWAEIVSTLYQGEKGLKLFGVTRDLTQRKEIEKRLQDARIAAEEAAEVKGAFVANMSHEVRTPMNAIIGMMHLALQTELDETQHNYIQKAHDSAKNLLVILNDIIDFSRMESGNLQMESISFSLSDVIDNMESLVRLKAYEKDIHLQVSIDPAVPDHLLGDPLRLGQILINLVANAVKFSHMAGQVRLSVQSEILPENKTRLLFSIADQGVGISLDQQQKLFQPFSQADNSTTRKYGGSGLGLMISRKLVELMGGEIWVDSELDKGSTFHFTVQLMTLTAGDVEQQLQIHDQQDQQTILETLRNKKILLVEDNDINQELVIELLESVGVVVSSAYDGEQALQILAQETFDGILMDCQMPVMDGYEATRRLRQMEGLSSLPVWALTANAMKGDKEKALSAGMNDHITKPINPDRLFRIMARWL